MQKLLVCLCVGQTQATGYGVEGRGWAGGGLSNFFRNQLYRYVASGTGLQDGATGH